MKPTCDLAQDVFGLWEHHERPHRDNRWTKLKNSSASHGFRKSLQNMHHRSRMRLDGIPDHIIPLLQGMLQQDYKIRDTMQQSLDKWTTVYKQKYPEGDSLDFVNDPSRQAPRCLDTCKSQCSKQCFVHNRDQSLPKFPKHQNDVCVGNGFVVGGEDLMPEYLETHFRFKEIY